MLNDTLQSILTLFVLKVEYLVMIEAGKKDTDRGLFIEHNQDMIFMYSHSAIYLARNKILFMRKNYIY